MLGQLLTFLAIALQSAGKVLYGTFLVSVSTPVFVLVGISLTAIVFLGYVRFRLPREGRGTLALLNIWTAVTFIGFFFALKHLPPAIYASLEIGASLLAALGLAAIASHQWPRMVRILACAGVLAGCGLLTIAELTMSGPRSGGGLVWLAIVASLAVGLSSALSATASRKLAVSGWRSASVLAHRFYLTVAVALVWLPMEFGAIELPDVQTLAVISAVAAVGLLVPLLLLQVALRRTDELSVMICMAAQPILSFLLSVPSPAYDWSLLTLIGVLVVTAFVGIDIAGQRWPAPDRRVAAG